MEFTTINNNGIDSMKKLKKKPVSLSREINKYDALVLKRNSGEEMREREEILKQQSSEEEIDIFLDRLFKTRGLENPNVKKKH